MCADHHGYGHKEDKKRGKDKDRKHRKRHQSATGDANSVKDGKEESKKSRRHSSDGKKLRKVEFCWCICCLTCGKCFNFHGDISWQHAYTPESDGESHESRQKRHKRDNQDGSHRNGGYEELEDGELGEDGEIR
jgi:pre-mRNA-processing factor 40